MPSYPSSSGSRSHPMSQPQPQPPDRKGLQRNNKDSKDSINAGFDSETRRQIANIAKISPPSLIEEGGRGGRGGGRGNEEHPLVTLHSVSGDNGGNGRNGKGERAGVESRSVAQSHTHTRQHTQAKTPSSDCDDTQLKRISETPLNLESKPSKEEPLDPPKSKATEEMGKKETHQDNRKTTSPTVLFKALVIIGLLPPWLWLIHLMVVDMSAQKSSPDFLTSLTDGLSAAQAGIASHSREWRKMISPYLPSFKVETESIPIGQYEKWIKSGQDLLQKYGDASGSLASCSSAHRAMVENHAKPRDDWTSMYLPTGADENRLASKALVCMGEANLALFSSPFGSKAIKRKHLAEAKDNFQAAVRIDPANPSVRSGSGLTYLLLGVMEHVQDDPLHFIFQSIQHLSATVTLTKSAKSEDVITIRTAAIHNLGLAYIALDGMISSSTETGTKTTNYFDWVTSIQSSQVFDSLLNSGSYSANLGALQLQMGKMAEAKSSLESIVSEICHDSLSRRPLCSTAKQNLAVAINALHGDDVREMIYTQSVNGAPIHDVVAQWNEDVSSYFASPVVATPESPVDMNTVSTLVDDINETDVDEESDTTSGMDSSDTNESNDDLVDKGASSSIEFAPNDEVVGLPSVPWGLKKGLKPEMQNAIKALEMATAKGPQRTRMLLALARARSSAGDTPGAVDAALKAINAATSDEETETSTSYLEMLMDKISGEDNTNKLTAEKGMLEKPEKTSSFVESKDFALTELQLKLELERLRYKVLEQEMRLGQRYQSNPPQYTDDLRAIDYQRETSNIAHDNNPRRDNYQRQKSGPGEEEVNTGNRARKSIDPDTVVELKETISIEEPKESEPVEMKNETVRIEEMEENKVATEPSSTSNETDTEAVTEDASEHERNETSNENNSTEFEEVPAAEPFLQLPSLYEPTLTSPKAIPPTAKSYMKMADAYLDKGQYSLAAKQFWKVIKKAPYHLPAHLGYATALERTGKSKQLSTAALAYGNATKVAIIQGERVDPMAKAGAGGIGENIMNRAVQIAKSAPSGRLETLRALSVHAHTAALAANIHYEIGIEISRQGIDKGENKASAVQAFRIASEFVAMRNDTETPYHIGSAIERAKIFLEHDNNASKAVELLNKVKNVHMKDDLHVELLVLVGRAHVFVGELESAIKELTRALSFPQCSFTPSAHHELAVALGKSNGDDHEINLHFEKALDLGMDPTPEAIQALGERNMSVMRALNRQYYKGLNGGSSDMLGGGILSGSGVGSQSTSVFAPQPKQQEATAQSETLTILEQGAAAYDGHTPMGGEVEGTESSLSNLKATKQRGSESNLSNLKR